MRSSVLAIFLNDRAVTKKILEQDEVNWINNLIRQTLQTEGAVQDVKEHYGS